MEGKKRSTESNKRLERNEHKSIKCLRSLSRDRGIATNRKLNETIIVGPNFGLRLTCDYDDFLTIRERSSSSPFASAPIKEQFCVAGWLGDGPFTEDLINIRQNFKSSPEIIWEAHNWSVLPLSFFFRLRLGQCQSHKNVKLIIRWNGRELMNGRVYFSWDEWAEIKRLSLLLWEAT